MRSSMFSSQLTALWYRPINWLRGLNLKSSFIPENIFGWVTSGPHCVCTFLCYLQTDVYPPYETSYFFLSLLRRWTMSKENKPMTTIHEHNVEMYWISCVTGWKDEEERRITSPTESDSHTVSIMGIVVTTVRIVRDKYKETFQIVNFGKILQTQNSRRDKLAIKRQT
jgi:hypothetical protein